MAGIVIRKRVGGRSNTPPARHAKNVRNVVVAKDVCTATSSSSKLQQLQLLCKFLRGRPRQNPNKLSVRASLHR